MSEETIKVDGNEMVKIMTNLAQGNIGALTCLMEIFKSDPVFINPLGIAISLTNTESSSLWIVYKDICKFDIEKTKKLLSEWFDNSTLPLQEWLDKMALNRG